MNDITGVHKPIFGDCCFLCAGHNLAAYNRHVVNGEWDEGIAQEVYIAFNF
jgi:hypothetical protein